jgi:amicyanin
MKQILVLLGCAILFLFVCGCSQPATVQPAVTVTATVTAAPTIVPEQSPVTVSPTPQKTPSVSDNTINIKNFAFDPASLTVKTGATVRWVNRDSVPHRIQFADKTLSLSPPLSSSQSYSTIFDRPGVYDYTCSIHPSMHGTVIVE